MWQKAALGGFLPAIAIDLLGMAWIAPPFLSFLFARELVGYCEGLSRSFAGPQETAKRPGAGIDLSRCDFLCCIQNNPGLQFCFSFQGHYKCLS
jgi:hypothetical protein